MSQKQLEDLHKTRDFIIERAYKLTGVYNLVIVLMLQGLKAPYLVLIVFSLGSLFIFFKFLLVFFKPSPSVLLGLKPSLLSIITSTKSGEEHSFHQLDRQNYFLKESTSNNEYYAWLVFELTRQHDEMSEINKALNKAYENIMNALTTQAIVTGVFWLGWELQHIIAFFERCRFQN